jgi:hypothetical protein
VRPLPALLVLAPATLLACHDDRPHVFQAPAPQVATGSPAVAVPSSPEVPLGTTGPEARITLVVDEATGQPVALTDLRGSVAVMTLAARGPGRPLSESGRLDLVVNGPKDTILVLPLNAPAPTIVAHMFQLDVGRDFRPGPYTLTARIAAGGRLLASSPPLHVVVGGPR